MKSIRLYALIALSGMMFGAQIVASHVTQSLALLVCSYHMLYNILSLLLLVISHRTSKGGTLKNTFGWARVKVLGMLVNMLFLCALCFAASVESVQTMVHASHENTEPRFPFLLLCLGLLIFGLNLACFFLIGGFTHHQGCSMIRKEEIQVNYVLADTEIPTETCPGAKSKRKTYTVQKDDDENEDDYWQRNVSRDHKLLDISRDISSCLSVIACACIILLLDGLILKYADSILAVASVIVLMATTYPFIRESGLILLQSIPNHVDVDGLSSRLRKEFPAIESVHDLHVWRLTTSEVIATVHIILSSADIYCDISSEMNDFFENEGINLVTIQPEFQKTKCKTQNGECILKCSSNNNCSALTCCGHLSVRQRAGVPFDCSTSGVEGSSVETASATKSEFELPLASEYDFSKFKTAIETSV